jgi:hypothetical protein
MKGGVNMPVPATTGQLKTSIQDMQIGDYIAINYNTSNTPRYQLGIGGLTEYPLTGVNGASPTNGYFYMIKVDKGLLISDRVVFHSVSWDTINGSWKEIQGHPITLGGIDGILRSLTGGVAYVDANGNKSTTDQNKGAFPTNNEYDKYIANFPSELIQSGKTLDDVFHYTVATWTQDTPISALQSSSYRINRSYKTGINITVSSGTGTWVGFRPVFEYQE